MATVRTTRPSSGRRRICHYLAKSLRLRVKHSSTLLGQSLLGAHQSPVEPFFKAQTGVNVNQPLAEESVRARQEFDAHEDILVCITHDAGLLNRGIEFCPARLNDWKELENIGRLARDQVKWSFCWDFGSPASGNSKSQE